MAQINLIRCSYCGERPPQRPAQVTWAWRRSDGERTAYRQNLCVTDYCANVLPLDQEIASGEPLQCPGCHVATDDDYDAVYITAFLPGYGKERITAPLCGSCAVEIRNRAQRGAQHLEPQSSGVQGLAPEQAPGSEDVWKSLGRLERG